MIKISKFLFCMVSLIFCLSFTSAWCYDYENDYGWADSYAKVCGDYPKCDGVLQDGNYCFGEWYLPLSFSGDKFYIAFRETNWADDWDETGIHDNFLKAIPNENYYITPENGKIPYYFICAWDYDSDKGDWAWASQCGGYLGSGDLGSFNLALCENGKDKCLGLNYVKCERSDWINKGLIDGKCGYIKPFCGDAIIQADENCENCEADVGKCPFNLKDWLYDLWMSILSKLGLASFSPPTSVSSVESSGASNE